MIYLGIDFGTSNSSIAFFDSERDILEIVRPEIEPDKLPGGNVYPSEVAFDRNGNMIAAGWYAAGYGRAYPKLVVDQVKRWIGKSYSEIRADFKLENLGYKIIEKDGKPQVEIGKRTYLPEEIVAYLLKHLMTEGKAYLKDEGIDLTDKNVTVIVTHPAYYTQNQVDAIKSAVTKMADGISDIHIERVRVIPEPMASICAAMHSGKLSKNDKYVMVVDEGAGTLDTMLVDMEQLNLGGNRETRAKGITIGGHVMLGGSDMDNRIVEMVLDELRKGENIDREEMKNLKNTYIRELRKEAESAKIDISEGRTKTAQIKVPGFSQLVNLTESQLNELVSPIIEECKEEILKSLDKIETNHKVPREKITKVILVGGPPRMHAFREMVNTILKAEVIEINPMECVATGAAVSPAVSYKIPADRTYGLLKKENKHVEFIEAVPKDTMLPGSAVIEWPLKAFSKIPIEVVQTLEEDVDEIVCLKMGRYVFSPKRIATEKTYFVVFKLDEERNVEVIVTSSSSKAEEYRDGRLGKEEISEDFTVTYTSVSDTCVIPRHVLPPDLKRKYNILFKSVPGLASKLQAARIILEESKRVRDYQMEDAQLMELSRKTVDVEDLHTKIWADIESKLEGISIEEDTIPERLAMEIKQLGHDILSSDDFVKFSISVETLSRKVDEIKAVVFYDKYNLRDLTEKISDTKAVTITLMRKLGDKLLPDIKKETEILLDDLDRLQEFLETRSEILVNSIEGENYREAENKEQMLRSIIDHKLRKLLTEIEGSD